MLYADYLLKDSELIPSVVTFGDNSTPVWAQGRWDTGEYQEFVRKKRLRSLLLCDGAKPSRHKNQSA